MEKVKVQWRQLAWLVLFSVAMGYLEAAVVVYLRAIYYPAGFDFPLKLMDSHHVLIELLREAATVIMLAGIGILAGKNANQRFSFFLVAFSIWDIFYYVFLKLLVDWPESLFTWDLLFLIPVPWIGPVITPLIICITMLKLAAVVYYRDHQNSEIRLHGKEWFLLIAGSMIVILSWTWNYWKISLNQNSPGAETLAALSQFMPDHFLWWTFAIGESLLLLAILIFWRRTGSRIN